MDYNLDSLGTRNFEHLTQALVAKWIGPKLVVFGDGPDGGREATWRGSAPSMGSLDNWDGYGVLQAKFKIISQSPAQNLTWFKTSIRDELVEWARPASKRHEKPEFLLFATNVRLSSVPDNGKDEINKYISDLITELSLSIKECRVLDYYEISSHLDGNASIRKRYAAFITSGDVIAALIKENEDLEEMFGQTLASYTARCLMDDNLLNLTQSGTAGDGQVTIADVFIDLPSELPPQSWISEDRQTDGNDSTEPENEYKYSFGQFDTRSGIVKHLVNDFNHIPDLRQADCADPHRTVLIGGPGQGKSTVTQWIAQMYRTEFLRGTLTAKQSNISNIITRTESRCKRLELPTIQARRWPIRIVLTELADYLAKSPGTSLLHYMAFKISDRSSFKIESSMLRKWLANYPWLVLIDGLDEVPTSSNRQQVMAAIQDFFIDAASIGGDVAAVATTRPQGYSDEFSSKEYNHFQLSSLEVDEALSYAEGLVAVRAGAGTSSAIKVMDRLTRASHEEHTRKLFESPLQVTILEVLLEKLGKAPSDRSRLYSSYYSVISQREQEKSGALSDLLQKYESDVDYLHRQIGFELQKRGSLAGESTSSLTSEEFDQFITDRFRHQGHSEEDVLILSRDFSSLVTDRLVFLAKLQADRIGFELRSLQEFMAGEYIVNLPESNVIPELHRISASSYWRNVVLFAIGSIFAHREHLRAEIVLLCEHMNDEPKSSTIILPGAELSVDILRDGSCLSMPKYAKSLAKNALRVIESQKSSYVQMLLFLRNTDLSEMLWEKLETSTSSSTSSWINRANILSFLCTEFDERASLALEKLFRTADVSTKRHLVEWAWETRDPNLSNVIGQEFLVCKPSSFFASRRLSSERRSFARRDEKLWPVWLRHLNAMCHFSRPTEWTNEDTETDDPVLRAGFSALGTELEAWEWIMTLESDDDEWIAMKKLASFASSPTEMTLADTLEAMQQLPSGLAPKIAPWPYVACMRHAMQATENDPSLTEDEVLTDLAAALRRGELGNAATWFAAQSRWPESIGITGELIETSGLATSPLPFQPSIASDGFVPTGYFYTVLGVHSEGNRDRILEIVRTMCANSSKERTWADLALFLAEQLVRREQSPEPDEFYEIFATICDTLLTDKTGPRRYSWLGLVPMTDTQPSAEVLKTVGSHPWLIGSLSTDRAQMLLTRALSVDDGLPLARLALAAEPLLLDSIPLESLELLSTGADDSLLGALKSARILLNASEESVWSGDCDDYIEAIIASKDRTFGAEWFTTILSDRVASQTLQVAARGAFVSANSHPALAERWLSIASMRNRTFAVPEQV